MIPDWVAAGLVAFVLAFTASAFYIWLVQHL
jgi:hypothetical protein